uniref:Uncharacterized protein n=1 Tax=Triticum urartu TaxID=4572 RepID=A0A8R7PW15_TRIUA
MTVQMLYAVAISSIVKVTPRAPSSVQPHGIRMIELVASSSPWLPSSTFLCLGPFLWRCKVAAKTRCTSSSFVCFSVHLLPNRESDFLCVYSTNKSLWLCLRMSTILSLG